MGDAVRALRDIVGAAHVLTDPDLTRGYTVDWTGRFGGASSAVVRPGSVEEVAAVVQWCAAHAVPVVPQGGNTGLVGGSVPRGGEVVVSLRRLDDLGPVDAVAAQVTVGAGATLEAVQRHVAPAGFDVAVDLAARGSATIGGMVATNAGGTRVLRHGPMRASVAGVEAVLGDGAVVAHLGGLLKDNTGYDLAGLLCGSEGTLGIVTRVRLRLVPTAAAHATLLLAVASVDDALACLVAARAAGAPVEGAEVFFHDGLRLVCEHLGLAPPFRGEHPVYLLLEASGRHDPTDELVEALAPAAERIIDTAVATAGGRREELWRFREAHTEAINAAGVPHKLDVTLPLGALPDFCEDVRAAVTAVAPAAETFLFGHLGDGNIHVNVIDRRGGGLPVELDGTVLGLVAGAGGSISAEHGIGTAKAPFLHLGRSPAEVDAFRRIKRALDPAGILNPGVILAPAEVTDVADRATLAGTEGDDMDQDQEPRSTVEGVARAAADVAKTAMETSRDVITTAMETAGDVATAAGDAAVEAAADAADAGAGAAAATADAGAEAADAVGTGIPSAAGVEPEVDVLGGGTAPSAEVLDQRPFPDESA